jgi:hypothetical protein
MLMVGRVMLEMGIVALNGRPKIEIEGEAGASLGRGDQNGKYRQLEAQDQTLAHG